MKQKWIIKRMGKYLLYATLGYITIVPTIAYIAGATRVVLRHSLN